MTATSVLVILLMLGALGALIFGIVLMASGGGDNAKANSLRQNKFMTYRIWFQAAAIIVLFIAFAIAKS